MNNSNVVKQNKTKKNILIELLIPIMLILNGYHFIGISNIYLSYFILVFATIYMVIKNFSKKSNAYNIMVYFLIWVFISLLNYMVLPIFSVSLVVTDIVKIFFIFIFIIELIKYKANYTTFKRIMITISVLSSVFLIFQLFVITFTNINIPNLFNFGLIVPKRDVVTSRPSSFYEEPAYFSSQIIVTLILILFDKTKTLKKSDFFILIFLGTSLILSTSTSGIFKFIFFIFLYYLTIEKHIFKTLIIAAIIITIVLNVNLISSYLSTLGEYGTTLAKNITKIKDVFVISRIGGSYISLTEIPKNRLIFGYGLGNEYLFFDEVKYLNFVTRFIIQVGILGFIIYIIFLIHFFKINKTFIAIFLMLNYIVGIMVGNGGFSINGLLSLSSITIANQIINELKIKNKHIEEGRMLIINEYI